jgi:hypothetical protein
MTQPDERAAWFHELRGPIHGRIQTIRGMCTDEEPHVQIDMALSRLDELVLELSDAIEHVPTPPVLERAQGRLP